MRLVIDTGVFIPGGDKSEEKIEAIKLFGNVLPQIAEKVGVEILLSIDILKEYQKIPAEIRKYDCHPLPKFHSSVFRNWDRLLRLRRLSKCTPKKLGHYGFHVYESSKLQEYDVEEFVDDKEDTKFLKVALAAANRGDVCLVSVDDGSLLKLRKDEGRFNLLCNKYREARNIRICPPDEAVMW